MDVQLKLPGTVPDYEAHAGHWHIGANMVGYLPESDIFCADNVQQAVEFFLSKVQEAYEECQDEIAGALEDGVTGEGEWPELAREIENMQAQGESKELQAKLLENHSYSYMFCPPKGADIRYWIEPQSYNRTDALMGKFSRSDICEIHMEQDDNELPYYHAESQAGQSNYWGPGHYFIYADKALIGRVCKDDITNKWWAFRNYLPPTPGKSGERKPCGEELPTRELAVRALWVEYKKDKDKE